MCLLRGGDVDVADEEGDEENELELEGVDSLLCTCKSLSTLGLLFCNNCKLLSSLSSLVCNYVNDVFIL